MYRYRLYGLNVQSDRAIALLQECEFGEADVHVAWGGRADDTLQWERRRGADLDRRRSLRVYSAAAGDGCWLKVSYGRSGGELTFVADESASHITILDDAAGESPDGESYFVGPMMGAILRLRGSLVMHASAVEIDGRAVCFIGAKYSGKSTHAAAFSRRGHGVLADDMAALSPRADGFDVSSGYSRLRLRRGTAELIDAEYQSRFAPVYAGGDSYYAPLDDAFHAPSLPLGAVYLLEVGDSGCVRPLQPVRALAPLGQNTFGNYVMTPATRRQEFAQLCALAAGVPVRALGVHYAIANLDAQCDAVLRDYRALAR